MSAVRQVAGSDRDDRGVGMGTWAVVIPAGRYESSAMTMVRVLTSRNVRGGLAVDVALGGLNLQIEHHLFPSMPRMHLAQTRQIVKDYCESLDVPYTETTLARSYAIVVEYLNRVGLAARDPFDCPMVDRFRRTS